MYTKEEWTNINEDTGRECLEIDAGGKKIALVMHEEFPVSGNKPYPREVAEAMTNARLMVSAKDMFELLNKILNSDMAMREEDEGNVSDDLNEIRAIIKQVTE